MSGGSEGSAEAGREVTLQRHPTPITQDTSMARIEREDGLSQIVSNGTKGAVAEYVASIWLIRQGYDVFRNMSPNGIADIIARKWSTDETLFIDVKSQYFNPEDRYKSLDEARRAFEKKEMSDRETYKKGLEQGIKFLIVSDDGKCNWYGDAEVVVEPAILTCHRSGRTFPHISQDLSNSDWGPIVRCINEHHLHLMAPEMVKFLGGIGRVLRITSNLTLTERRGLKAAYNRVIKDSELVAENDNDAMETAA